MTNNTPSDKKEEETPKKEVETKKAAPTKEKLRSIMEAASALTSLNEEGGSNPGSPRSTSPPPKRYIPEHKKPDAALTFPEKLMFMMSYADKAENKETFCVAWLPDGKSFVVRDANEFTKKVLPKFFKATKFSSFTRKLYRWGFRQVNRGIGPDDPIIFGNEHFQRDNAAMMVKMRSTTAAGTRKQNEIRGKRGLDDDVADEQRKRMMIGWGAAKDAHMGAMPGAPPGYGAPFNLASALRPSLGMQAMNPLFFQQQQQAAQMEQQKRLNFLQNMQQGQPGMQQMQSGQPNPAMFLPSQGMGMGPMGMGMGGMGGMGMPNQFPNSMNSAIPAGVNNQNNNSSQGGGDQQQQQQPPQQQQMGGGPNGQFPGAASTAEIVNAAINALRYAN